MPRKNNKKNKNKGKPGHGRERNRGATARNKPLSAATGSSSATLEGKTPTQWEKWKNREKALNEEFPTVYSRYKTATNRFFEYMIKACPSEMGEGRNTNSLLAAADWMAATGHIMERSVLRDLKLAIRIRTRVANSVYGGGDAGHKHFLNVLTYCWYVLNALLKSVRENDKSKPQKEDTNHFGALMEEDDEDDDVAEEDEKMFPSNPVPRPSSLGREPLSLDELMHSDDRHDAIIFLLTLDEIMGAIVLQYETSVLKNLRFYQRIGCPESAIVEELMEAAVATNMAIQQVQKLEIDLMVQHEHLTTPYRLLATLVLPEITQNVMSTVRQHAAKGGCTEKDITMYLGDCLESYCRNLRDPYNRKDVIVKEFCRTWQVDSVGSRELEELSKGLDHYVRFEIPLGTEKADFARLPRLGLPGSHSWIQNMPFIGGDRAIHHTLRLLQTFGDVVRDTPQNRGIEAKPGFFGKSPWVPGQSHKIRDLDELLMADIMPKMVLMCRKGIIGETKLPREDELCPLFVLMRKYVKEPEKPVSWSIVFAIHAMLTAVLEVDPVFDKIVEVTKTVFDNYFDQLEWATTLAKNNPESIGNINSTAGQQWAHNMIGVGFLKNFGLPVFGDRALWNPLCAGTILSYLNYFGNLEAGCAIIDCHAQLRITLHLFHALLANGILCEGQIPMLDMIYDGFRNSKAIWGGRRLPERGEFVNRFWICFGSNRADARRMSDDAKETFLEMQHARRSVNNRKASGNGTRKLVPIEPAEISKSYRRICNRDFHDVVDRYHTPEQRMRGKGTDQYNLMVRTNDTLDAIDDEQKLLSMNLPSCGVIIEQFVNSLGRILQWEPLLAHGSTMMEGAAADQRQGFAYLFAQYLLGALDFADDPFRYTFLEVPLGEASSHFMSIYFGKLDTRRAMWFQAVQEEE